MPKPKVSREEEEKLLRAIFGDKEEKVDPAECKGHCMHDPVTGEPTHSIREVVKNPICCYCDWVEKGV